MNRTLPVRKGVQLWKCLFVLLAALFVGLTFYSGTLMFSILSDKKLAESAIVESRRNVLNAVPPTWKEPPPQPPNPIEVLNDSRKPKLRGEARVPVLPALPDHPVAPQTPRVGGVPGLRGHVPSESEERVLNMLRFVWKEYAARCFGSDEIRPFSGGCNNRWGGMGMTLVDSLDTLWLMGMHKEFDIAREWVRDKLNFDNVGRVSLFETNIRVLGGLLSAYSLTKDEIFKAKALDLGRRFTRSIRFGSWPPQFVNLNIGSGIGGSGMQNLAEVGTLQLEFKYLSYITGDTIFDRISDDLFEHIERVRNPQIGLVPQDISFRTTSFFFVAADLEESSIEGSPLSLLYFHLSGSRFSFGGCSDSYYEYLLKCWIQSGKKNENLKLRYKKSIEAMVQHLVFRAGHRVFVGSLSSGSPIHIMEHLTCFISGTLVLGAQELKDADYDRDMKLADQIAETCMEMYRLSPTGMSPESVTVRPDGSMVPHDVYSILRPETVESLYMLFKYTHNEKYRNWGREILSGLERSAKTTYGYSGLENAMNKNSIKDETESFFIAETLKYLYLLLGPTDSIDLSRFVFNTEAHPLEIFQ